MEKLDSLMKLYYCRRWKRSGEVLEAYNYERVVETSKLWNFGTLRGRMTLLFSNFPLSRVLLYINII